jgi:hypothetical protein
MRKLGAHGEFDDKEFPAAPGIDCAAGALPTADDAGSVLDFCAGDEDGDGDDDAGVEEAEAGDEGCDGAAADCAVGEDGDDDAVEVGAAAGAARAAGLAAADGPGADEGVAGAAVDEDVDGAAGALEAIAGANAAVALDGADALDQLLFICTMSPRGMIAPSRTKTGIVPSGAAMVMLLPPR